MWLTVATRLSGTGCTKCADVRNALAKELPRMRLAEAEERAREWIEAFERRTQ